jgi:hypothetical protein
MSGEPLSDPVREARKACRHFAMLYFNFCRALTDALGEEAAFPIAQRAVFNLSLDRTDRMRQRAAGEGIPANLENFQALNDLASLAWEGWDPGSGEVRCPYAQAWIGYFGEFPWFRRFASMFCDVIDTTNIENFSRDTTHRLTKSLLWGDGSCEREYFPSDDVRNGKFTYGERPPG